MLQDYLIKNNSAEDKCTKIYNILTIKYLILRTVKLLIGFFLATVLSTLPGQTGDWTIIGASVIVSSLEYLSYHIYSNYSNQWRQSKYYLLIMDIKIGITYGLFVDSFKLGS